MAKPYQLRVRLDGETYQRLLQVLSDSKKTSLSIFVREAIGAYLDSKYLAVQGNPIPISECTRKQIAEMAQKLDRPERQVLEDCVQGIIDNLNEDKTPLIVLELLLRREYLGKLSRLENCQPIEQL